MKRLPFLTRALVLAALLIAVILSSAFPPACLAQNGTWTATGPTAGNWTDSGNWLGGTIAGTTGTTTNTGIFTNNTGTTLQTINVDSQRNVQSITLQWTANNGGKTFDGGSLWLTSGGTLQKATGGGAYTNTFNTPIELQGDGGTYTFANNSTVTTNILNIVGGVTGVSTGVNVTTLTLTGTNNAAQGGTNTISGVIGDGAGGGKLGVSKTNLNAWILTGTNTYSGNTLISAGTLQIGNGGAAGSLSPSSTITNNGVFGINRNNGVVQGTDFANGITGTGSLVKSGAGILTLNTSNSYGGGTSIAASGGTILLAANNAIGSGNLSIGNGATLDMSTFNASLTGISHFVTGGTIDGTGTLTFAGDLNLGYLNSVAATTINAKLSGTGKARHVAGTNTVVHLTNPNNDYTGGTDVGGSNIGLTRFVSGGLGTSGTIRFMGSVGPLQWATGNTQDISSRIVINAGVVAGMDTNGNNVTFASSLGTSTGGLAKSGAGKLTLSTAASALTGAFTFSNGGLVLQNANTGTGGVLTVNNNGQEANGFLEVASGANYTFNSILIQGSNNVNNAGIHQTGGTLKSIGAFTVQGGFGPANSRYSYISGGNLDIGTNLRVGDSGGSGGNFHNQFNMSGGTVTVGGQVHFGKAGTGGDGLSQFIMSGGSFTSTGELLLKPRSNNSDQANLIMGGGTTTVNNSASGVQLGADSNTGNGRVFLAGNSVLQAHKIVKNSATTTDGKFNTVFFSGGTLRALSDNNVDFLGAAATPASGNSALGNNTSNVAFIYSGGATIDTNGFDVTVNPSLVPRATSTLQSLGSVTGFNIGNVGSNYSIAPNVGFSGGGGAGAAGYATLDTNGGIAAIIITDPGTGYTSAPTVTLSGGALLSSGGVAATPAGWTVNLQSATGGGLTKIGLGVAKLMGSNTYTGQTNVNLGTLLVNGTHTGGGLYTVNSGGTLGGTGSTASAVSVVSGGTLSPGNSPGTFSTGSQTWNTGGNYNWQMLDATSTPGTGWDLLDITGTLTIASGFNFNLWSLSSISPDVNGNANNLNNAVDSYWLVAFASSGLSGAGNLATANIFTAANNGTSGFSNPLAGGSFSLVQGNTGGSPGTTNEVYLKFTAASAAIVPEPSTWALALLGLAGLAIVAIRGRASA